MFYATFRRGPRRFTTHHDTLLDRALEIIMYTSMMFDVEAMWEAEDGYVNDVC